MPKPTKQRATKVLLVRVPPDLHRALKVRAATEGTSMAVVAERALNAYLIVNRRGVPR